MSAAEWTPAFEGQRPPFEPGNTVAMRHGARSERVIAPLARRIVQDPLADPSLSYLSAPRYAASLEAWGRAEGRVRLLRAWLEQHAEDGVGAY